MNTVTNPITTSDLLAMARLAESANQSGLASSLFALAGRLGRDRANDVDLEDDEPFEVAVARGYAINSRLIAAKQAKRPQRRLFADL